MNSIHWLPKPDYDKAVGQLRMQARGILDFLRVDDKLPVRYIYGLGIYIEGAVEEMVELAEDFSVRVRGDKDQPIRVKKKRNARR